MLYRTALSLLSASFGYRVRRSLYVPLIRDRTLYQANSELERKNSSDARPVVLVFVHVTSRVNAQSTKKTGATSPYQSVALSGRCNFFLTLRLRVFSGRNYRHVLSPFFKFQSTYSFVCLFR